MQDPLLPPIDTAGTYLFPVFISSPHGCGDTSIVTVDVLPAPIASITNTPMSCHDAGDGSAMVNTQDAQDQIVWTSLGDTTSQVEGLGPGEYPVTITSSNGCVSTLVAEIAPVPPMIGSVQVTTATCGAANGTATVLFVVDTTGMTILWDPDSTAGGTSIVLPPGPGSVHALAANGCSDSALFIIPDTGTFSVGIVPDTILIPNNGSTPIEVSVSPADMPVDLIWSPDSSLSCATCAEVIATPPFHQTYVVVATNGLGCTATDSVYVMLDLRMAEFFLPDVFSPNGDGLNDELCVFGDVSELHLEVFDRWGARMFESRDRSHCWNGTFLGKPVDSGTYFFKVTAVLTDGTRMDRSGEVRTRP